MGNKKKVSFNKECFEAAKKFRKRTNKDLSNDVINGDINNHEHIEKSSKFIQRCSKDGEMPYEQLDKLASVLDVDPDYLSGKYPSVFNACPDKFPYIKKCNEKK